MNPPHANAPERRRTRAIALAVTVAALGYFVDIYDLIIFSVVRDSSLASLGLPADAIFERGIQILNAQMLGMLIGGVVWGALADRHGRLSTLFGSIILYSLANIANGLVQDVTLYAVVRFIAGLGLAGELGAGVTLVSELLGRRSRGYGTSIVAAVGICGAVAAVLVAKSVGWRAAYVIGGGLGLALLLLRVGVLESSLFAQSKEQAVSRGNFLLLFSSWTRAKRYIAVVLVGLPIWFIVGIPISFAREIGGSMGMAIPPSNASAVMATYIGLVVGDITSGTLSQLLRSRRKVIAMFVGATAVLLLAYVFVGPSSLRAFYAICAGLGVAIGYWAVFVTVATEQFGTNIRATAATTAPNFVRGAVVPLTLTFKWLSTFTGNVGATLVVGGATCLIALLALRALEETYGKDLAYLETWQAARISQAPVPGRRRS